MAHDVAGLTLGFPRRSMCIWRLHSPSPDNAIRDISVCLVDRCHCEQQDNHRSTYLGILKATTPLTRFRSTEATFSTLLAESPF